MVIFNDKWRPLVLGVRSIRLVPSRAPGRMLLTAALFAGLLGLMPGRVVYASLNLVVNDIADFDYGACVPSECTLRDALYVANLNAPIPTAITFSVNGVINLNSTLPIINGTVSIDGTGHSITIDGNGAVEVLRVNTGATLQLQSITVANGLGPSCVGIPCGGVYNLGTLAVISSTLSDNSGGHYGNPGNYGGGIYNNGTLTVTNSTFSDNRSVSFGGGLFNTAFGTLNMVNSTFSGNSADVSGGGIYNSGILNLTNSTFVSNTATTGGGILNYSTGMLNMINSIIAHTSGANGGCYSFGLTFGNHNLIEEGFLQCGFPNGVNGNIDGVDPRLGLLTNNGGTTLTMLPLPGSPAINSGDNASCPAFDQRGVKRPQGGICDIGAVESLIWPRAFTPMIQK
jgi:predicted outer membrane repeat protein